MRDKANDDPLSSPKVQGRFSATLSAIGTYWQAYWKLALGVLLVALLVVFVVQNANAIHVKFFVWEAEMSQALVVFLAVLLGAVFGLVFNKWQRWRSSRI